MIPLSMMVSSGMLCVCVSLFCSNSVNGIQFSINPLIQGARSEAPPDFGVSDVERVAQLVLPGQPSTQPLHHAVAQDLQVTASRCTCKTAA